MEKILPEPMTGKKSEWALLYSTQPFFVCVFLYFYYLTVG